MEHLRNPSVDRLFQSFLNLKTLDECYAYFEDLCTFKEVRDMAQRLDTAVLLYQGTGYLNITEITGLSSATISRVSKCLQYGPGGYATALDRLGIEKATDPEETEE